MFFKLLTAAFGLALLAASAAPSFATASRTFVSPSGSDQNICSQSSPCLTFQGALTNTYPGGEINCLEPGGFGPVTINKSVTIDCQGTLGGLQSSGTTAITINAADTDRVYLRNLDIDGLNGGPNAPGLNGISILHAGAVSIENVKIFNFSQHGIVDTRSIPGTLNVINTSIEYMQTGIATATSGGRLTLIIDHVRSSGNFFYGVALSTNTVASIKNSVLSNNGNAGIDNEGALILANDNVIISNGVGILNQANGVTRLSNNELAANTTAINNKSGYVVTWGNNRNPGPNIGIITPAGNPSSDFGLQ